MSKAKPQKIIFEEVELISEDNLTLAPIRAFVVRKLVNRTTPPIGAIMAPSLADSMAEQIEALAIEVTGAKSKGTARLPRGRGIAQDYLDRMEAVAMAGGYDAMPTGEVIISS